MRLRFGMLVGDFPLARPLTGFFHEKWRPPACHSCQCNGEPPMHAMTSARTKSVPLNCLVWPLDLLFCAISVVALDRPSRSPRPGRAHALHAWGGGRACRMHASVTGIPKQAERRPTKIGTRNCQLCSMPKTRRTQKRSHRMHTIRAASWPKG